MDGLVHMSTTSSGNTPESNIEDGALTKRSFFARAEAFGTAEGRGDNSRPGLFVLTCEAARARILEEKDAEEIFDRYSKKVALGQGIGWKAQSSAKQQTSKLRTAIKLGLLPQVNGLEVCNTVLACQREQRAANEGKNDYSPFDGLVKVARYQITNPDQQLKKDVIEGLLIKPAKDEPEEADRLEKIMKAAEALAGSKENPVSPETADMLGEVQSTIMTRIRELGGSTSMRKRAAKAEKGEQEALALVDAARAARREADAKLVGYLAKRREELVGTEVAA